MDRLEYAKLLTTVKHGKHNQLTHGYRFGKTPSLAQARRLRKAGLFGDYKKRSRVKKPKKGASRSAAVQGDKKPKKKIDPKKITLESDYGFNTTLDEFMKEEYNDRADVDMAYERLEYKMPVGKKPPVSKSQFANLYPKPMILSKDRVKKLKKVVLRGMPVKEWISDIKRMHRRRPMKRGDAYRSFMSGTNWENLDAGITEDIFTALFEARM